MRDQKRERRVGQQNERQVGKEESEKRLRDFLEERGVRQEIERLLGHVREPDN